MINRVKVLGYAVSGNLDTHILTATPYSTNAQVSQYEEVILEVLTEGFTDARSVKLNFTLPDGSTVDDIHMKPIGNNKFQIRINDVIGNKLTVGTTQTVNVEIIVYTREGYAKTETPVAYQLYRTSIDTTYHPTDMDVAFIAINQLISDTSGSDGNLTEIKDKLDRLVNGDAPVGRAIADASGNVITETYMTAEDLPTKTSQLTNDGDGNQPYITRAALSNYATKSEIPTDFYSKETVDAKIDGATRYTDIQLSTEIDNLRTSSDSKYSTKDELRSYAAQHTSEYNALNDKVNHFLDVDDTTKDQLSEIIDLIDKAGGSAELVAEVNKKADKDSVYTKEETDTHINNAVEDAYGTVIEIGINDGYISGNDLIFNYTDTFKNNTRYFLSLHAALTTRTGDLPDDLNVYITDGNGAKIGITCIAQPDITKTSTTKHLNQIERQDPINGFYWYAMAIYRDTSDGKTFYIDTINCEEYSVLTGEELESKIQNSNVKPGQYIFATTTSGSIKKGHTYRINGDISGGTLEVHEEDVSGVFGGESIQIKFGDSGTLTEAQLLKLQQNDDNYIITTDDNQHYEIFKLSTEASKNGYRTYSCIEYENSRPIIRTITITESVRAWVMKSTEIGSGSGGTVDITIDDTVKSDSNNAVSGKAVYNAIDTATSNLNSIITTKTDAITDSLSTVATSGSYTDLTNKPVIPSLIGYATESYVNEKTKSVENKIPDVSNYVDNGTFNTKISEVEGKIPSTIGLASKEYVDSKFDTLPTSIPSRDELNNAISGVEAKIPNVSGLASISYVDSKVSAVYRYRGSVSSYDKLPSSPEIGDVYNVEDTGMNYAWSNTGWDSLGSMIDISGKQDTLVSGTNIKTINNQSILGEGNISIEVKNIDLTDYAKKTDLDSYVTKSSATIDDTLTIGNASIGSGSITFAGQRSDNGNPLFTSLSVNNSNGKLFTESSSYGSNAGTLATEKWVSNQGYLTEHQSLNDYALKTEIPTNISSFNNDSGYLTSDQLSSDYALKSDIPTLQTLVDKTNGINMYTDEGYAGFTFGDYKSSIYIDGREIGFSGKDDKDNIIEARLAIIGDNKIGLVKYDEEEKDDYYYLLLTENTALNMFALKSSLNNYALKSSIPSLDGYATTEYVDGKIPTKTSQLENDSGYLTEHQSLSEYITKTELNDKGYITNSALVGYARESQIPTNVSELTNDSEFITITTLSGYAKSVDIPTKTSQLTNDSNFLTAVPETYAKKTDIPTIPSDVSAFNNDAGYLTSDSLSSYATTEYVDNKISSVYKYRNSVANYDALPSTGNIIGDVYNVEDTGMNYAWTGTKWDALGSTVDLSGYATQSWVEGKGYLTQHQSLDNYALKSEIPSIDNLATKTELSTVENKIPTTFKTINGESIIGTGEITISTAIIDDDSISLNKTYSSSKTDSTYAKKTDIPSLSGYATEEFVTSKGYLTAIPDTYALKSDIPAKVSEFKNDAGYLTSTSLEGYATETWIDNKGYATTEYVDSKIPTSPTGTVVKFISWED